jgi:N-acetylmuramoyl-L-alanine amidase
MPRYEVKDNFLYIDGEQVEYRPSPNHGGEIEPTLIIEHYTGDDSERGAISWLCASKSGVSAHLVINKEGKVTQLVPFNVVAWHAGRSQYMGRSSVNSFSIGIENVGSGDFFSDAQYEVNRAVIAALFEAYPIDDVVGHEDVAPGRKNDPGPNFDWNRVVTR